MDQQAIVKRIDELGDIGRRRMDSGPYHPSIQYAEIFFMTDEEVSELHALKAMLPSPKKEMKEAAERIRVKIAARRNK